MYKPGDFSFNNTDQQAVLNETYWAIDYFRAWQELSIEFGRNNFHIDHISFKMIKLVYIAISDKFGHAACRMALRDVQSIARFGWETYVAKQAKKSIDLQEPQCVADDEDDVFNSIYEEAPVMTRSTFVTGATAQALAAPIGPSSHIDCDDPICY